jgi:hypothetical protein
MTILVFVLSSSFAKEIPRLGYGISYYPRQKFTAEKLAFDLSYKFTLVKTKMQFGIELNSALDKVGNITNSDNIFLYNTDRFSQEYKEGSNTKIKELGRSYGVSAILMPELTKNLYIGAKVDAIYLNPKHKNPFKWYTELAFQCQYDFYVRDEKTIGAVATISNNYYQVGFRIFI